LIEVGREMRVLEEEEKRIIDVKMDLEEGRNSEGGGLENSR